MRPGGWRTVGLTLLGVPGPPNLARHGASKSNGGRCDRSTTYHGFTKILETQDSGQPHQPKQQLQELRLSTPTFAIFGAFRWQGVRGTKSRLLSQKTVRRRRWRHRFSMTLQSPL